MNQTGKLITVVAFYFGCSVFPAHLALAQDRAQDAALIARRKAIERELESVAIIERKVMVPMRDGKRMQADIYRPKDESKKYPIIFVRTPYNFNYWDVELGAPRDLSAELDAVKRGYAAVEINERGRYFSEGDYDILGTPLTDADDEFNWMSAQPWATGKVGLIGCSSTAEWQINVASRGNKALATFIPESFGDGIGRVGPYYEQGNWFRGGAMQMRFSRWLAMSGILTSDGRPNFPSGMSQQALLTTAKTYDLAQKPPIVDWDKAYLHLPTKDILVAAGAPHSIYDAPTPSGQKPMSERTPNDPSWYVGGLWNDSMKIDIPGLWIMTWYDNSVAPNLAAYNYVRRTASRAVADQQYAVIAPVPHCSYKRAEEHTIVGARDIGDARLDYDALTFGWFDYFLKGEENGLLAKTPKVHYYTMGLNKWQSSDTWPPKGAKPVTYFLVSQGRANSLVGDGALLASPPGKDNLDQFVYDPMNPVPTPGGSSYNLGADHRAGAFDQRGLEMRNDILVYTTEPLSKGIQVSGPVDVILYVSSDAKDTDFTVKLIDVQPDGTAWNLDDNIQRVRYREGYDKPPVWMEKGKVYKVTFQPMQTSNYFAPGDRLRIEISSSNFPLYDRNLNTGGNNYDETTGVVAHNEVHHSAEYPSSVTLSVVEQ
jgi:putative CocE/NonD family hydrolase